MIRKLSLTTVAAAFLLGSGCAGPRVLSDSSSRGQAPPETPPVEVARVPEPPPAVRFAEEQTPLPAPTSPAETTDKSPSPPPAIVGERSVGGPLALAEVLDAVETHYPLLRAAEQERALAGGRLLSSLGVFDLNLAATADGQGTTYDNFRSGFGVSQGLPVGGLSAFAGYRNGYGDFPTYNLGQKTADGGEFRAGLTVPLLRDRVIDRPRANIEQARIDVRLAEPLVERQRIDFQRAATRTYWGWVGSGYRLKLAESLVELAVERDEQLKARVEAGPTANIERTDNRQNIALRRGILVQAQRAFQQASIELSLFLRDATGTPTIAGTDRLPAFPDVRPVDPKGFDGWLRTALDARPEPRRLRLLRDKAAVELRLAENQTLPTVNAVVTGAQDVGFGKSSLSGPNGLDRATLNAGVSFALPLQRRDARGRATVALAQLAQLEQQLRQAEDVVRAEVQDALSALERSVEFVAQAKERVELARLVARAERELLRLGRSDVLRVTLREQAAFDAEVIEVGARQDYFRALAEFRAALGVTGRE
jgi:outer membrane protein, heavy metal efflux system